MASKLNRTGRGGIRLAAGVAVGWLLAAAGAANAQVSPITLNYNFHGAATTSDYTTVANNANADIILFRSIGDRAVVWDIANNQSPLFYAGQPIGNTRLSYQFAETLSIPGGNPNGLNIVSLGARCTGLAPQTIFAYEAAVNAATNVGTAPVWGACPDLRTASTTTISPGIVLESASEIGILSHASNGSGAAFDVVLGFSDSTSVTVRMNSADWFNSTATPAIPANSPVSTIGRLRHTVGTTTYTTWQGTNNNDAPVIQTFSTTNGGQNLVIWEGIISVPLMTAGVGTFPATNVVGKTLTSITFQNATWPASGGRGYAIFAASVGGNNPAAVCANAATVTNSSVGDTAGSNFRTLGLNPASSYGGGNDTTAVWYKYQPSTSNPITVRTCGASFDTTLGVFDGCGGTLVASNDNSTVCGASSTSSLVTFNGVAGTTYYIRVAGKANATGTFTLSIDDVPNTDCGNAVNIATGTTTNLKTVLTANTTGSPCGSSDVHAVWFNYVAPASRDVEIRTCGNTTNDTTLSVWGSCGATTPVACNDNGCGTQSRVRFTATAGVAYKIRVALNTSATGTFGLTIDDPANTDITMPLQFNFNGICHGTSERTLPDAVGLGTTNENRCNPFGFRAIADRGLLCDGLATDALNYGGTVGYQGLVYQIYGAAGQSDMVHLGNRNLAANGDRQWISGTPCPSTQITPKDLRNNGTLPSWLQNDDQTGPQTSSMASLDAVFGADTKIGVLYHMANVDTLSGTTPRPATFDVRLTFTDGSSCVATCQSADWFGTNTQVLPAAPATSGLEVQRQLGIYRGVQNTDRASDALTAGRLKVFEAVISTQALIAQGVANGSNFNPIGKTLATITFENKKSGNAAQDSLYSALGIYAATLRNPASFNLNAGPEAVGTVSGPLLVAGSTSKFLVSVSRGTGSPNNITSVTVDGSSIGLPPAIALNDSATPGTGDAAPNDNVWSRSFSIPLSAALGPVSLPYRLIDAQGRSFDGTIVFSITAPFIGITPTTAVVGSEPVATVTLSNAGLATPNIASVVVDGSALGLSGSIPLNDTGANGDALASNGVYSGRIRVPLGTPAGTYALPFVATDSGGATATGQVNLTVSVPTVTFTPTSGFAGSTVTASINLALNGIQATQLTSVNVDASSVGLGTVALLDNGAAPDATAGDGTYTGSFVIPVATPGGTYNFSVGAFDAGGAYSVVRSFTVSVINDLGTLAAGNTTFQVPHPVSTEIHWYRFTLASPIDRAAGSFLDIDTEGSALVTNNDTEIGLFNASTGVRIADDDDDGSGLLSQLSFGLDTPARPAVNGSVAYNGRDGATLAAGTYLLAVSSFNTTFADGPSVTSTSAYSGTITVNIRRGVIVPGSPPTTFTDLGTLNPGTPINSSGAVTAGGVAWFRVNLPAADSAAAVRTYLDIDTEGSGLANTVLAVFDTNGNVVASDDDDGSGTLSQLTFGRGTRPAVNGSLDYNGRDGATFTAGTYYIAIAESPTIFAGGWTVFNATGTTAGTANLNLRAGFQNRIFAGPFFNPANNSTYYLLESGMNWTDAEAAAAADVGGHLASISDAAENEFVRTTVLGTGGVFNRRGWIGLYDSTFTTALTGQVWTWSDNTPFGYSNWGTNEPNNGSPAGQIGQEHYVEMLGDGTWNDIPLAGASGGAFAIVEVPSAAGICCRGAACAVLAPADCTVAPGARAGVFTTAGTACNLPGTRTPCCIADYNKQNNVDLLDIFAFLEDWFGGQPYTNHNGDANASGDLLDIFSFLADWFAGPCV